MIKKPQRHKHTHTQTHKPMLHLMEHSLFKNASLHTTTLTCQQGFVSVVDQWRFTTTEPG